MGKVTNSIKWLGEAPGKTVNSIKRFVKELKRVRWPSGEKMTRTFLTTLVFIGIASIILFVITLGFTNLWTTLGVGLHGE